MRPLDVSAMIDEEAARAGISPEFMSRIIFRGENNGLSDIPTAATNPKSGATGIGQVMPTVFERLKQQGVLPADASITDPRMNLRASAAVLQDGLRKGSGSESVAAAHYNGGTVQAAAVLAGKQPPATETQAYLQRTAPMGTTPTASTSVTTREKSQDEPTGLMQDNLSHFLDQNRIVMSLLTDALGAGTTASAQGASAAERAGSASGARELAEGQKADIEKADKINTADVFGLNFQTPNSRLQQLETRKAEAIDSATLLFDRIAQEATVQPWDDPLRWLVNKVTLPALVNAHNTAIGVRNQAQRDISEAQQNAIQHNMLDIAPTREAIRIAAAAKAGEAVFQGVLQGQQLRANSAHVTAQALMQNMATNGTELVARQEVAKAFMTTLQLRDANADRKGMLANLDAVNMKLIAAGMPPEKSYTEFEFNHLAKDRRDALLSVARIDGFGDGPGSSKRMFESENLTQGLSVKAPVVYTFLTKMLGSDEFNQALADMRTPGLPGHNPAFAKLPLAEQQNIVLDAVAQKQAAGVDGKAIRGNNMLPDANPYKLRIADVIQNPALANNTFVKEISSRIQQDPRTPVTHDDLMRIFLAKAATDPANLVRYAQDLSDYFNKGIEWQWKVGGAAQLGYPHPQQYIVSSIQTNATGRALNTAGIAEIENWAVSNLTSQNRQTITEQLGSPLMQNTPPGFMPGMPNMTTPANAAIGRAGGQQ